MSRTLTFEIPDELFEAIQRIAAASGRETDEVALEWLARRSSTKQKTEPAAGRDVARQKFEQRFGSWHSRQNNLADNDRIDADLALGLLDSLENEPGC